MAKTLNPKRLPMKDNPKKEQALNKRLTQTESKPVDDMLSTVDAFINDLDCAKDMFEIVTPILLSQDKKREDDLNSTIESLSQTCKDGKRQKDKILSHAMEILNIAKKLNRADQFFKSHTLVCLISRYDCFLSNILSLAFAARPEKITNQSKSLTYDELLGLDNLDNLLQAFAAKEIDLLLRDSHAKQIEYLDKEYKLGLKNEFDKYCDFIELTERRNLFVHNGGIVNKQYLKKCKEEGYKFPTEIVLKQTLTVEESYFSKAYTCLVELGVRIGYALAVRLFPESKEEILDHMHQNVAYPMLKKSSLMLARSIYLFGLSWPEKYHPSEELRRYYIINTALCYLGLGEKDEAFKIIDNEDWSSQSDKFHLAVAVLKEDWESATKIMRSLKPGDPFSEESYRDFPLFQKFIKTDEFRSCFAKIYRRPFSNNPSIKPQDAIKQMIIEVKSREEITSTSNANDSKENQTKTKGVNAKKGAREAVKAVLNCTRNSGHT